ncbi:MAG TPA: TPM domain-containing protein [Allosphingosinicella sp.]|nr:TPM domain-containing protein [Allosphingosinicella sp.]
MTGAAIALAAGLLAFAAGDSGAPAPQASAAAAAALAAARPPAAARDAALPELSGRVVDEAELLSPEEEARLTAELAALERRTTDQLVIVTVRGLRGRSIEDFGRSLGNGWGIGQADKDNGVLLVVAPAERLTRIEVANGLEAILTDDRARSIVERDLVPNFREGRWHEGIEAGARAIIATLIAHEGTPRRGRP